MIGKEGETVFSYYNAVLFIIFPYFILLECLGRPMWSFFGVDYYPVHP